jgi:hypothetical protein
MGIRLLPTGDMKPKGDARVVMAVARQNGFQIVPVDDDNRTLAAASVVIIEHVMMPKLIAERLESKNVRTLGDLAVMTVAMLWECITPGINDAYCQAMTAIFKLMHEHGISFLDADPGKLIAKDIELLELTKRFYRVIKRHGIESIAFLRYWTEADLLDIDYVGTKAIGEIRLKLGELGLTLRGE